MIKVDLSVKRLALHSLSLLVLAVCFSTVSSMADEYFGGKNKKLKTDINRWLQNLEKFDKSNSSMDAFAGSIRDFFKYTDLTRHDELTSMMFSYSKLRQDLFPRVDERRSAKKGHAMLKTNVLLKRKDNLFFLIYPYRPSMEFMSTKLKKGEDGVWKFDDLEEPIKNFVLVTMFWKKRRPHHYFRNITVDFRYDSLSEHCHSVIQEFDRPRYD